MAHHATACSVQAGKIHCSSKLGQCCSLQEVYSGTVSRCYGDRWNSRMQRQRSLATRTVSALSRAALH
jgi:hypothetical protein